MFDFGVWQDSKISSKNAINLYQGGLSLPDRQFYFEKDSRSVMIRKKFVVHLDNMYKIMGYDAIKAKQAAENQMKLETALASASRKKEDTRDPLKNYTKLTASQLSALMPNFNWSVFFMESDLAKVDSVIVGQPEYLKALNSELKKLSMDDWKNYLKYKFIRGMA